MLGAGREDSDFPFPATPLNGGIFFLTPLAVLAFSSPSRPTMFNFKDSPGFGVAALDDVEEEVEEDFEEEEEEELLEDLEPFDFDREDLLLTFTSSFSLLEDDDDDFFFFFFGSSLSSSFFPSSTFLSAFSFAGEDDMAELLRKISL
tara:strand:- start:641 stop:1081 length:441 start_codon:yes stop_codon:yes gene_type:complete